MSVSAPHHGTPLATFFTGILGQKLLQVLSMTTVATLRQGRLPMSVLARIGAALARVGLPGSSTEAILDHLEAELLGRLDPEERYPVAQFFAEIGKEQALLPQLTPDGIDLFNAAAADRSGVRYACVVSCARRPRWIGHFKVGPRVTGQASYAVYRFLHSQTNDEATVRLPDPSLAHRDALQRMLGSMPTRADNASCRSTRSSGVSSSTPRAQTTWTSSATSPASRRTTTGSRPDRSSTRRRSTPSGTTSRSTSRPSAGAGSGPADSGRLGQAD